MIKISAQTIEDALLLASEKLHCSCADLEYEVVQYPSDGIFGLWKKEAKIVASIKSKRPKPQKPQTRGCDDVIKEISKEINELFSLLPFELDTIQVSKYDDNTLFIHFTGKDSALLIGEKGYRYRAISYMLFNWINAHYGFNIRLEIETFLQIQEKKVEKYLEPIIHDIMASDKPFATKPLDGTLIHIALKRLREYFPDRSVVIKTNESKQTYIAITKREHE